MPDVQHFVVATAGHVDHGKSALVRALTGTDPDRLPEEKLRGITIDLGFAYLELPSPAASSSSFLLGIVDVPGHEDFVRNMVSGVGSIDLAMLIVAADDGWMPQTEEHLQILTYLGVRQLVVALTKIDLAPDEKRVTASVHEQLRNTHFADAPIFPTSVVSGRGLDELKSGLASVLAKTPRPRNIEKPRLPVDRVFNLPGVGTIVTGTLMGGTLRRGQEVIVQPSGNVGRVRTIQSHNRNSEMIMPGTRTALNLPGLVVTQDVERGDVVTLPGFGGPSDTIDVRLEISARARRRIKNGARTWIHHGSHHTAATVELFAGKTLESGQDALAQLRLETPAFLFVGDRFVIRDWAEQNTLGGGVVLDADAQRAFFRNEARMKFLQQRADSPDLRSHLVSQLARDGAVLRSRLLLKSRFSKVEIAAAVSSLIAEGVFIAAGDYVADAARWSAVRRRALEAIDDRYRARPEDAGMPLSDLRAILNDDLPPGELFDALIQDLCKLDAVQNGAAIRRVGHQPALPPSLQESGARLRAQFARNPLDPPSRKELAPDSAAQQALRFLIRTGEVVEISTDVVMTREAERQATESICRFIGDHGPATVSSLRQSIGSSRRVMIPLLERLDRAGVTERVADKRGLRRQT